MSPKGFTLIEVLVALSLASITLIAISASLLYSNRLARFSLQEAQAYSLIQFMAGHIQSNPAAATSGVFQQAASQHTACYQLSGCTADDMAKHALYDWQQRITQTLPSGAGIICPTPPPTSLRCNLSDRALVLGIRWQAPSGEYSVYQPVSF